MKDSLSVLNGVSLLHPPPQQPEIAALNVVRRGRPAKRNETGNLILREDFFKRERILATHKKMLFSAN